MSTIASVFGRLINDSRGEPTVEVTVTSDLGNLATASIPAGSSVGKYEAHAVSGDAALATITSTITPALLRQPLDDQKKLDGILQSFDLSPFKENIGVNSTLPVSLAIARLIAQEQNLPLYHYLQHISGSPALTLPIPMFNLINGGKHASNNLAFQEYMVIPIGMTTFHDRLTAGSNIFAALGQILNSKGLDSSIGIEGGYAPNFSTNEEGLGYLVEAIKAAGYQPGVDVYLGLDVAASSVPPTYTPTVEGYVALFQNFPLYSIEDPFDEDAWDKWAELKAKVDQLDDPHRPHLLVGDDLFVGNPERLKVGIQKYVANAILIKINQASTLTEILEAISIAREYKYVHIISHRSGETLDTFISDLAVGTGAAFIKAGSPSNQAPERITKYEHINEIEEELSIEQGHGH